MGVELSSFFLVLLFVLFFFPFLSISFAIPLGLFGRLGVLGGTLLFTTFLLFSVVRMMDSKSNSEACPFSMISQFP